MGCDFIYTTMPKCDLTAERREQVQRLWDRFIGAECDSSDAEDFEIISRERMHEFFNEYPRLHLRRDNGYIRANGYLSFITGGMTYGDAPTDSFELIRGWLDEEYCPPELESFLNDWAFEDAEAARMKRTESGGTNP